MVQNDPLIGCTGFEWDDGNSTMTWERHHVTRSECEEVFFFEPLLIAEDLAHSQAERRYYALGQTANGRRLFVVFTVRNHLIRVISARPMSRNERRVYERKEEESQATPET